MKKKNKERTIAIKLLLCIIYLITITILFVGSYRLFELKKNILPWSEVESVDDYTYIDIYKMSEKFAFYEESNIGIHFVIEKEDTGLWHTYLIAINENEYDKYKAIIDYTYERTEKVPDIIRVYGYPIITTPEMKELAIKNIAKFVPAENEVVITEENYETYLTNSYLDTTQSRKDNFDILLCTSFLLLFIVMALFIMTIFDKGKTKIIKEKDDTDEIKPKKKKQKRVKEEE